ncbi:hypothetical protein ABNK63_01525 [Rhodanobacter sp. IGA1.0]|uniref:Uncharacterized protein n=2 Tax=Rhodanobacter TaxID=75309 RepID=A0AAU7QLQ4_9GAMM
MTLRQALAIYLLTVGTVDGCTGWLRMENRSEAESSEAGEISRSTHSDFLSKDKGSMLERPENIR